MASLSFTTSSARLTSASTLTTRGSTDRTRPKVTSWINVAWSTISAVVSSWFLPTTTATAMRLFGVRLIQGRSSFHLW